MFRSIPENIRTDMEAPTHIKSEDSFIFIHLLAALHWQHIEKERKEVRKGVFNFCLQDDVNFFYQKCRNTSIFKGIDRGELGVVDLVIEVFKIRSKIWWLQKDKQTIEKTKLYGVQMEDDTT